MFIHKKKLRVTKYNIWEKVTAPDFTTYSERPLTVKYISL